MSDLIKYRETLHQWGAYGDMVVYAKSVDEELETPTKVYLRADVWREMGRPQMVTLTVEPGDTLNL